MKKSDSMELTEAAPVGIAGLAAVLGLVAEMARRIHENTADARLQSTAAVSAPRRTSGSAALEHSPR